ncbi:hypothetical protein V6N13_132217 [Hibiscus sabdariffa]
MEKRVLRTKGMTSMKYGISSEYFTIVMHHGGFMVNSPRFRYSGNEVSFFDMCHIDSMSILEMYDIIEELGYGGKYKLYWKHPGRRFNVKHLRTDTDVIAMLACMPRNKQLHVYLEEDVGESNETVRTNSNPPVRTDSNPPIRTEEPVRTEEPKTISSDEDSDYVADSGFEDSEDAGSDEEGFAHKVHVQMESEMDMNNLNSDLLSGCPAVTLDDEEVNDGSESLHSATESDSDAEQNRKPKCPEFNTESDSPNPQFEKGMIFGDKETLKQAVRQYEIKNRIDVKFKRTCNKKVQVVCKEGCPWYIWASRVDPKDKMNMTWQIKSYIGNHTCMMGFKNRNATYKWLAKTYIENNMAKPKYSTRHLKRDVMSDHLYKVSLSKCLRAKNLALEMVLGSHKGQYLMIYDYLGEIRTSNLGSTTILMLDNRVFLRVYICLHACKESYKAGCRPVLSIDGYHLKGYCGGTFLAAVSVDANDSIYPIAYAIVEAETESCWNWFLSLLGADLGIRSSHNITIVSDKQKGLKEAILEVFPAAEHRNCFRHLYSNFKNQQGFKGKNLKDALWKAARATYLKLFEDAMDELKALSKNAFDWLNGKDPAQWSKPHFSPRSKSDMLLSNLSECFNKHIYSHFIQPMRGPNQWVKDTSCELVIEPKLRRPLGRPKKKRAKEADEAQNSGARWTKKGLTMYCSKCKKPGHNQRTCKGEVGSNKKRTTTQTRGPSDSHSSIRTSKLQVRRATTLSAPHVMPTSSSPPVMPTTFTSPHVMATPLSPPVLGHDTQKQGTAEQ